MVTPTEQYGRAAADWRHYDTALWAMPTAGLAIVAGVLRVTFVDLSGEPAAQLVLLVLGTFFTFSLAVAAVKHRLFQDVRAHVMADLEGQPGHLTDFPMQTASALAYLSGRKAERLPTAPLSASRVFDHLSAAALMTASLALACAGLALLALRIVLALA